MNRSGNSENHFEQIPPRLEHVATLQSGDHGRNDGEQSEHRHIFHRGAASFVGQESAKVFHSPNIFGFIGVGVYSRMCRTNPGKMCGLHGPG